MTTRNREAVRWAMLVTIVALWAASLALPAVSVAGGPDLDGLDILRRGWQGARAGVFAWYANPLFVIAVGMGIFAWQRCAGVISGLAVVLALTSFAASELAQGSGVAATALSFDIGFYLWLGAQLGMLMWSWAFVYSRGITALQ